MVRMPCSACSDAAEKVKGVNTVLQKSSFGLEVAKFSMITCALVPPNPKLFTLARRGVSGAIFGQSLAVVTISRLW